MTSFELVGRTKTITAETVNKCNKAFIRDYGEAKDEIINVVVVDLTKAHTSYKFQNYTKFLNHFNI
tara:strand:+ start:88 stop:285 length:198 start_codon:yes stop_codon:yes gene_type:complete